MNCGYLCQKYACSLYYALTEELPNFKPQIELNRKQDTKYTPVIFFKG